MTSSTGAAGRSTSWKGERTGPVSSRRDFVRQGAASIVGAALPLSIAMKRAPAEGFIDLRRPPDRVTVRTSSSEQVLQRTPGTADEWDGAGLSLRTAGDANALRVELAAPGAEVVNVSLRWRGSLDPVRLLLGDAWERGYGDLEWREFVPDRVMPWYVMTWDGTRAHGYGVRTGAGTFCSWRADPGGISLIADVRSGGNAIRLGGRTLPVCDVVCRRGRAGESAYQALHAFCRQMCPAPLRPTQPVFGSNDWYWAYGNNSARSALADAERIVDLSPGGANRPFVVIDDGWQPGRGADRNGAGTWDHGNDKFGDMASVAAGIARAGARPGIWIRPLEAPADAPGSWRLPRGRGVLDPTVPEVRARIANDVARLRQWGMQLIKHDYTTYDLLGRWGNTMGSALTQDGWSFAEGPRRSTAEVIGELYGTIREAAGPALVIGCNTVSHLSAGHFEICRIGDDTSGREWDRTRRMGVNSLAFRGAQHAAFYAADADCVGVTTSIPWALNREWLDLLARSGTTLFTSLAPDALGPDQRRDLTAAFAIAARPRPLGEPLDWQQTVQPTRWKLMGATQRYDWDESGGRPTG